MGEVNATRHCAAALRCFPCFSIYNPQFGQLSRHPLGAGVLPSLSFAGRRVLEEALSIVSQNPDVEAIRQDLVLPPARAVKS